MVGGVALFRSDCFPQLDTPLDEVVGGGVDPKLAAASDLDRLQALLCRAGGEPQHAADVWDAPGV